VCLFAGVIKGYLHMKILGLSNPKFKNFIHPLQLIGKVSYNEQIMVQKAFLPYYLKSKCHGSKEQIDLEKKVFIVLKVFWISFVSSIITVVLQVLLS
jgi:hypothetical protein